MLDRPVHLSIHIQKTGLLTALAATPLFWAAPIALVLVFSEPFARLLAFYSAAGSKARPPLALLFRPFSSART